MALGVDYDAPHLSARLASATQGGGALMASVLVPVGAGVLYDASGTRPPNKGEEVIKPPAPAGPFGEGGAPGSGDASAMPEDQSNTGQDAIGALAELGEDADADDRGEPSGTSWRRWIDELHRSPARAARQPGLTFGEFAAWASGCRK